MAKKKVVKNPTLEAVKELGRVVLISVLPVLVDSLMASEISWRAIVIAIAVASLKAVDKWLHEKGKLEGSEGLTKGLTQF